MTYGIIIKFKKKNQEPQQLRYKLDIKSGTVVNNKYLVYQLNKRDIYINDRLPEAVVDELAVTCGNSIYPIRLGINAQGRIVKVFNHEEITQRWEAQKEKLEAKYEGEMADWYITKTDQTISRSSYVRKAVRQELFLSLYFLPIRLNYGSQTPPPSHVHLPVVPYTLAVQYAIEQHTNSTDSQNSYSVHLHGQVDDERSAATLCAGAPVAMPANEANNQPAEGTMDITYRLAKHAGTKKAIVANIDIQLSYNQSRSVSIEAYKIND